MKKITIKTAAGEPTTQGFRIVRNYEHEQFITIQRPDGFFDTFKRAKFTSLEQYSKDVQTPFKYDADGKKIWYSEPFYLDYVNNYFGTIKMAEDYNITEGMANILIDAGRAENHKK